MGSITRSFANNIGSSGILTASAVTNATVEDVTSFDNAASPATLVLLSTQTANDSATISFTTGLDSTYDMYEFKFIDIETNTSGYPDFTFNMSTDGGSNYNVTKTTTYFRARHTEDDATTALEYRTGDDLAQSTGEQPIIRDLGTGADESAVGSLLLFNPSSTTYVKHFICNTNMYAVSNQTIENFVAGYGNTTSAVNAIRFQFATGNIQAGTIKLYGVKKS